MIPIFVFGSNLAGIHGAGAALTAIQRHGAKHSLGVGRWGNSYAIPTKDCSLRSLPLHSINNYVLQFKDYAQLAFLLDPEITFRITRIGCGLAGFNDDDISPMFVNSPMNCQFDSKWINRLGTKYTYWGTYP